MKVIVVVMTMAVVMVMVMVMMVMMMMVMMVMMDNMMNTILPPSALASLFEPCIQCCVGCGS